LGDRCGDAVGFSFLTKAATQRAPTSRKELNTHQSGRFSSLHAKRQFHASVWTASPETSSKSRSTFVDATLPLNERGKRFAVRFVFRGVPQHTRPLGSSSLVYFLTISGAQDDRGKWFVGGWQV
jgi:hypothetical protein